jgi:uncharacterized protein (TIGR03435 family)
MKPAVALLFACGGILAQPALVAPTFDVASEMMLQTLLADRFKLRLRQETKEFPVYALVVEKNGPKVKPLKDGESGSCNSLACAIETIAQMAKGLENFAGRPILDKTGLEGRFSLPLDFDVYEARAETPPPDYNKPSLFTALREQLGLRLEPQKAILPALVIASITRPTEN